MQVILLNSITNSKSALKFYFDDFKANFSFCQNRLPNYIKKNVLDIHFSIDLDKLIIILSPTYKY